MNLATIGWPSGTDTGWPSEPRNMLPGRVEGFPAGVQASANTAERLLSQAVGWWDADHYRDGDRLLRNRGVAGELLDLQLGSSGRVATSNDPLFLAPEDSGYVYLPGVAGNYLSVPDSAALDITGDIDIRVQVALDDWTPASEVSIINKYDTSIAQRSYQIRVLTSGELRLWWSETGAAGINAASTTATGIANGSSKWVRVTLDVDNGASGYDVKFWLSDDGVSWLQLGTTVTGGSTTSIYAGTDTLQIGGNISSSLYSAGKFYRAQVWDGIEGSGGTKVLDVDTSLVASGSDTSFTALTGQTVTINRSTSGRKAVAVPSRANRGGALFLFGTDDYMEVVNEWQHQLLNFDAGDSFTVLAVVRKFATIPVNGRVINKRGPTARYDLYNHSNNPSLRATLIDGDSDVVEVIGASSWLNNELTVLGMILNRGDDTLATFSNGSVSSTTSAASIDSLSDSGSLDIGRRGDGSAYADMEFYAAAVFRRALTADEIATLTNYFAGRIA